MEMLDVNRKIWREVITEVFDDKMSSGLLKITKKGS